MYVHAREDKPKHSFSMGACTAMDAWPTREVYFSSRGQYYHQHHLKGTVTPPESYCCRYEHLKDSESCAKLLTETVASSSSVVLLLHVCGADVKPFGQHFDYLRSSPT